jgi:Protein of unknown function (DUF3109)
MIFEIEDKLVTSEIFENNFVCDLSACKGECCVAGDSGAPVEKDEIPVMEHILPIVKKYMMQNGIAQIEKDGVAVIDYDYEYVTPLIGKIGACAFVYFDKEDVAKCAIEAAYNAGEITFQKPISCHLYPIRLSKLTNYTAINYNRWHICKPACACGNKLEVPIYKFLRTPIERKFGKEFFKQLELAAAELEK